MNHDEMKVKLVEIAERHKVTMSGKQSDLILKDLFAEFKDVLVAKDDVKMLGIGTLKIRERAARVGRNPKTMEPINIPAKNTVVLTPGKALKDSINQ